MKLKHDLAEEIFNYLDVDYDLEDQEELNDFYLSIINVLKEQDKAIVDLTEKFLFKSFKYKSIKEQMKDLIKCVGPGFHLDTDPIDYITKETNERSFSDEECDQMENCIEEFMVFYGDRCYIEALNICHEFWPKYFPKQY